MSKVVEVSALTKSYRDVTALDQVSFSIEAGKIYGLLGRNGAGKATIVRIIPGVSFAAHVLTIQNYGYVDVPPLVPWITLTTPRQLAETTPSILWGPAGCTGQVLIAINGPPQDAAQGYASVTLWAQVKHYD